ncbi:uncharacterized protein LOC123966775 [Micropterus dolomieu]|uniref:uncharacterized protein LOC123966775 n=1 Tax=Micropterus dolomieu TaxID=147949 RepID=UPI001E8CFCA0|nr:uncharacterized protein LOC123966775 [Micropterus dolomieu]
MENGDGMPWKSASQNKSESAGAVLHRQGGEECGMDMPDTLQRDYQSIPDMDHAAESWKKFYVYLAGKTNDAHLSFVSKLKCVGQIQVDSLEESDYILVFCPIASRAGTDISEAEDSMPRNKPVILVVMHHTFDPDRAVAESRRKVTNPNVRLTVDCLFYEGRLLESDRNYIAWFDIQRFLGVPDNKVYKIVVWLRSHLKQIALGVLGGGVVLLVTVIIAVKIKNKKDN